MIKDEFNLTEAFVLGHNGCVTFKELVPPTFGNGLITKVFVKTVGNIELQPLTEFDIVVTESTVFPIFTNCELGIVRIPTPPEKATEAVAEAKVLEPDKL